MQRRLLAVLLSTLLLFGVAFAQDNPIEVRIEAYIVSQVTADDGVADSGT